MALEHAILVSLRERPASGLDLTRRFDASIGFFWNATHQQIYRVLGRMEQHGWVRATRVVQQGRPDKKQYDVTAAGCDELARWLAEPSPAESFRSDLAVRLRGASYGDRVAVLADVHRQRAEHAARLAHYQQLAARDFPAGPPGPVGPPGRTNDIADARRLDVYLVLRGGIRLEQFWVEWLTEYLDTHVPAHGSADSPTETRRPQGASA